MKENIIILKLEIMKKIVLFIGICLFSNQVATAQRDSISDYREELKMEVSIMGGMSGIFPLHQFFENKPSNLDYTKSEIKPSGKEFLMVCIDATSHFNTRHNVKYDFFENSFYFVNGYYNDRFSVYCSILKNIENKKSYFGVGVEKIYPIQNQKNIKYLLFSEIGSTDFMAKYFIILGIRLKISVFTGPDKVSNFTAGPD